MYGQITCMLLEGGNCGMCYFAHTEQSGIGGRVRTLERDTKWAFSENLCHQTLSLSNVCTQEIHIA